MDVGDVDGSTGEIVGFGVTKEAQTHKYLESKECNQS